MVSVNLWLTLNEHPVETGLKMIQNLLKTVFLFHFHNIV